MKQSDAINIFCDEIWAWYARHKRTLPWRDLIEENSTQRAYLVLVSEMMLQQTQVHRVINLYKKFIQIFPTLEALSKASNSEVIIAWRGLGYNKRALRLRDAARTIISNFDGVFPHDFDQLLSIKGIGHYTAAAVRNFAFELPTPCIDTNIRRILHRFFVGPENSDGTWKKNDKELLKLAEKVLVQALGECPTCTAKHRSGKKLSSDWHAALMDFGSLVCTKKTPDWQRFPLPLQKICKSFGHSFHRTERKRKEPGRLMSGKYIPNRIFRGKIIEVLRDATKGLAFNDLGSLAIHDWTQEDSQAWLKLLLQSLIEDEMIEVKKSRYYLRD